MQTKKFTDIDIVNRVGMYYYHITLPETDILLITGDRGYPHYYQIEITFLDVEYFACVFYIDDVYTWRVASPEETKCVLQAFSDRDSHATVYCLEENIRHQRRKARKFFIAARTVEIIAHYDAHNSHHLASLGLGEQNNQA